MRLDKFICKSTELTRNDAKKLLKAKLVTVNDQVTTSAACKLGEGDVVKIEEEVISLIGHRYIMLNKPEEMICSTTDEVYPSILHLIDVERVFDLHIAGRLDVDTTGLVLITDDGKWSHNITSPNKGCQKTYRVITRVDITDDMVSALEQGVELHNEKAMTKPAMVEVIDSRQMLLTISEGKYHQVKRMLAAVGNKVIELHREKIGSISLDTTLDFGQWRYLTEDEIALFK
ncbi:16S rRNA pseudouridine(516) synthase RsuA [Thalassotalea sp. LPB0316]|uniref:16S rRNA pseudouridine(516) synthase RsuA n=1 Tax=Thalassotalea sp. LPB0316 TaxID=2769490 RepID=UPI0018684888|nr:16S rRNA pseudouridine(516) synthase RsuA [Thalassotalea sp. LPB0316]QOL25146.1 16S rRNA pseudouridine(516) synthase RsuA [Thalassotalea sp. LPB0316]